MGDKKTKKISKKMKPLVFDNVVANRAKLRTDKAYRKITEGLKKDIEDLISSNRLDIGCCIEGCCVSWCCVKVTVD